MSFRPSIGLSVVVLPLGLVCLWLGNWQLDRAEQKQALFSAFENARQTTLGSALRERDVGEEISFARVSASGHFEPTWHLLLDNKIEGGQAGVHVYTLFRSSGGSTILVNRGWLPMPPDRSSLPVFKTPDGLVEISGMLINQPQEGVKLGQPDELSSLDGPRLVTYLSIEDLQSNLDEPVSSQLILLDPSSQVGFGKRDWRPAVMKPVQHQAYAFQWFSISVALLIIWLVLGLRRKPAGVVSAASNTEKSNIKKVGNR